MRCDHFCNTLNCATCIRRFWKWAENHTRGMGPRARRGASEGAAGMPYAMSFYEAAATSSPSVFR